MRAARRNPSRRSFLRGRPVQPDPARRRAANVLGGPALARARAEGCVIITDTRSWPHRPMSSDMETNGTVGAAKVWVLTHLGLVIAITSVAFAIAVFVFAPMSGLATRRPRP